MTGSARTRSSAAETSRRLSEAALQVLYEQGVERSTLADIARVAGVPSGNVYYHFKSKDALVAGAIAAHRSRQDTLLAALAERSDPRERLEGLIDDWVGHRNAAARWGCPTATLAMEVGKRANEELVSEARALYVALIDWIADQFHALGPGDSRSMALSLLSRYEGMAVLAQVLRDPEVIVQQSVMLRSWLREV